VIPATHEQAVYTVEEFCEAYRMSRQTLYRLWKEGIGPRRSKIVGKITIRVEAGKEWHRGFEVADDDAA
jgi:hypothetical protein